MVVLFDGVCNLCNAAVDFIMRRDPRGRIRFASRQSDAARKLLRERGLEGEADGSIVVVVDGRSYTRSRAALEIARRLRAPWPLLYGLRVIPPFARNALYDWIARNRYRWFGKRETCRMPDAAAKDRFLE